MEAETETATTDSASKEVHVEPLETVEAATVTDVQPLGPYSPPKIQRLGAAAYVGDVDETAPSEEPTEGLVERTADDTDEKEQPPASTDTEISRETNDETTPENLKKPARKMTGLPRVATMQKKPIPKATEAVKSTSTKVWKDLPRVAMIQKPTKKEEPSTEHETKKPVKTRTGLPRVATMQKKTTDEVVGVPIDKPVEHHATKLTSLPRVATIPIPKIHVTKSTDSGDNTKPSKKLTGLPRVAILHQTPSREKNEKPSNVVQFHARPVPQYPSPKERAPLIPVRPVRNSPSKEERDLRECQNKFKALPLPHFIEKEVEDLPHTHPKGPVTTIDSDEVQSKQFKALPMPDFAAEHARVAAMAQLKPVTTPIPFSFHTEKRINARRERGTTAAPHASVTQAVNVTPAATTSSSARSTRRHVRPHHNNVHTAHPNAAVGTNGESSQESSQPSRGVQSTPRSEVVPMSHHEEALEELLMDDDDHELDKLLAGGGEEEEVKFDSTNNNDAQVGADELDKVLGSQEIVNIDSPIDCGKALDPKDNSPNDVQTVNLDAVDDDGEKQEAVQPTSLDAKFDAATKTEAPAVPVDHESAAAS